jgi:hypothetical protein
VTGLPDAEISESEDVNGTPADFIGTQSELHAGGAGDPIQEGFLLGGPSAASAFSSQKLMSISRYIVSAIRSCSSAFV